MILALAYSVALSDHIGDVDDDVRVAARRAGVEIPETDEGGFDAAAISKSGIESFWEEF